MNHEAELANQGGRRNRSLCLGKHPPLEELKAKVKQTVADYHAARERMRSTIIKAKASLDMAHATLRQAREQSELGSWRVGELGIGVRQGFPSE